MNSIVEIVDKIKQRPAMYIGRNSIFCLKAFLDGWYLRSSNDVSDSGIMNEFQDRIVKKYDIKSAHSWCDILLFYSQDEGKALELFFNEFEEFLEVNNR
ncbi:hypothetical protein [Flavobacterium poyangense]|uniref:hypothetical protein n=1 Tax=Flavobacterium poyangense TaxID=2204302 RepID=UPI001420B6AA|nr:hypothetical protein [Flavobacterium sp. JXAS1]